MPAATAATIALAKPVKGSGSTSSTVATACSTANGQSSRDAMRFRSSFHASSMITSMNAESAK